jgi:hypothetical protein
LPPPPVDTTSKEKERAEAKEFDERLDDVVESMTGDIEEYRGLGGDVSMSTSFDQEEQEKKQQAQRRSSRNKNPNPKYYE